MILFFQRLTAAAAAASASAADGQSPEYLLRINQRRAKAKKISKMKKVLVLNQVSLSSIQFPSDALILRPL